MVVAKRIVPEVAANAAIKRMHAIPGREST